MTYLITFACYGAHLHGDESGSVDRHHNRYRSPRLPEDPQRVSTERRKMTHSPYLLDSHSRPIVLGAIRETCLHHAWVLLAAHVRTNHVHIVVEADVPPEKAMHAFKSYASRALNRLEAEQLGRKRWVRHGSTRWLWKDDDVREAIRYVVENQGEPMALFPAEEPPTEPPYGAATVMTQRATRSDFGH